MAKKTKMKAKKNPTDVNLLVREVVESRNRGKDHAHTTAEQETQEVI